MTTVPMTEKQLIESQKGEGWLRVMLVDQDGKPVPVQYDHEGRLKMAVLQQDAASAYNAGYGDATEKDCAEFTHLGLDEHVKAGYHHSQLMAVAKLQQYNISQAAQQAAQIFSTIRDHTYVDAEPPELRGQNESNYRRAIEALAALAKVGVTP